MSNKNCPAERREMGKRTRTPKQNKRSVVISILDGKYSIEVAARIMRVETDTIKRWLHTFGRDVLLEDVNL